MRARAFIQILVVDVVLLALIALVVQDRLWRLQYFQSIGFSPSTTYSVFTLVTSAVHGGTYIPGLLTIDWVQILAVLLALFNLAFVLSELGQRKPRAA